MGDCKSTGSLRLAGGLDGVFGRAALLFSLRNAPRIFAPLLPNDTTFLTSERTPLLEQLCPEFTAEDAIVILASLDAGQLEDRRRRGEYNPVAVLQWFEEHRDELNADLREQFASLPIFPSVKSLRPLPALYLPGGFEDSLGVADILDSRVSDRLFSFLRELGIRQLTFEEYAGHHIPQAFAKGSTLDKEGGSSWYAGEAHW